MQPAEANGQPPDEPSTKKKRRKNGQQAGAVQSIEGPREADGQPPDASLPNGEPAAKKKRRKSGQQPGADQSNEEPRGAEQNRGKQAAQGPGKSSYGGSKKEDPDLPETAAASQGAQPPQPAPGLLDKMAARLHGSRFR